MIYNISDLNVVTEFKGSFDERCRKCLAIIDSYGFQYREVGVFGNYVRESSNIKFCMIIEHHPNRVDSESIRQDLEDVGAELVYVTRDTFENSPRPIYRNMRRDYKRLL